MKHYLHGCFFYHFPLVLKDGMNAIFICFLYAYRTYYSPGISDILKQRASVLINSDEAYSKMPYLIRLQLNNAFILRFL